MTSLSVPVSDVSGGVLYCQLEQHDARHPNFATLWLSFLQHVQSRPDLYSADVIRQWYQHAKQRFADDEWRKHIDYVTLYCNWINAALAASSGSDTDYEEAYARFQSMYADRIGIQCAIMYKHWAAVARECEQKDIDVGEYNHDDIVQLAIKQRAQPIGLLCTAVTVTATENDTMVVSFANRTKTPALAASGAVAAAAPTTASPTLVTFGPSASRADVVAASVSASAPAAFSSTPSGIPSSLSLSATDIDTENDTVVSFANHAKTPAGHSADSTLVTVSANVASSLLFSDSPTSCVSSSSALAAPAPALPAPARAPPASAPAPVPASASAFASVSSPILPPPPPPSTSQSMSVCDPDDTVVSFPKPKPAPAAGPPAQTASRRRVPPLILLATTNRSNLQPPQRVRVGDEAMSSSSSPTAVIESESASASVVVSRRSVTPVRSAVAEGGSRKRSPPASSASSASSTISTQGPGFSPSRPPISSSETNAGSAYLPISGPLSSHPEGDETEASQTTTTASAPPCVLATKRYKTELNPATESTKRKEPPPPAPAPQPQLLPASSSAAPAGTPATAAAVSLNPIVPATSVSTISSTGPAAPAPASAPAPAAAKTAFRAMVRVGLVDYEVLEVVGRGGTSEVYKVLRCRDNSIFAMKRIRLDRDPHQNKMYQNELDLLVKLRGKQNIILLVHADQDATKKHLFMVFEYGEIDLFRLLAKSRESGVNENYVRCWWSQMLESVQVIHEERVVHGDLKPANFMIVQGQLKLIDFGIARAIQNDTTNISRDSQIGTLNYMPPEALDESDSGQFKVGRAGDVWALGCILYQMVYGVTPFAHITNMMKKIAAITGKQPITCSPTINVGQPNSPSFHQQQLSSTLLDTIQRCLQRDPSQRPTIPQLLTHPFLNPTAAVAIIAASVAPTIGHPATSPGVIGVQQAPKQLRLVVGQAPQNENEPPAVSFCQPGSAVTATTTTTATTARRQPLQPHNPNVGNPAANAATINPSSASVSHIANVNVRRAGTGRTNVSASASRAGTVAPQDAINKEIKEKAYNLKHVPPKVTHLGTSKINKPLPNSKQLRSNSSGGQPTSTRAAASAAVVGASSVEVHHIFSGMRHTIRSQVAGEDDTTENEFTANGTHFNTEDWR